VRCPEWAAAGTFAEVWRTCTEVTNAPVDAARIYAGMALRGLAAAHVVTTTAEQVEALPAFDSYGDSAALATRYRPPFDPLFISLDHAPMPRFGSGHDMFALGALIGRPPPQIDGWDQSYPTIWPFVRVRTQTVVPTFLIAWPSSSDDSPSGFGWDIHDCLTTLDDLARGMNLAPDEADRLAREHQTIALDVAEMAYSVLFLLDSANVELVEGSPNRQERRAVERRGGRVALTVRVSSPKRRPRDDHDQRKHIDYSHRFEVRGHYKHFPRGTRLADHDPSNIKPCPRCNECRRIWCPPFVKGPEDKPLIPKVRVVT